MTSDGNHGGATEEETNSVLLVYSPAKVNSRLSPTTQRRSVFFFYMLDVRFIRLLLMRRFSRYRSIPQVDLVSSVSLLLGLPIPFGNLGALIPELFLRTDLEGDWHPEIAKHAHSGDVKVSELTSALAKLNLLMHVNVRQIYQYVRTYSSQRPLFSKSEMHQLEELYHLAIDSHAKVLAREVHIPGAQLLLAHSEVYDKYRAAQQYISALCRRLWTSFDEPRMVSEADLMF